ncbi:alpha-D-mannose-specific plant lectin, partial [Acephala macrosclerotiorum]
MPGDSVISTDGRFTFTLQTDGNLVLYGPANQPLWASNTNGHEDFSFTMQKDGNLVLYGPQGQPLWATNTNGHTNIWNVIMQGDGNLVVYDAHSGVLWASNTQGNVGSYLAVLNSGNVVIYNVNNTIIWQTNTIVPTQPTAHSQGDRLLTSQGLVPGTSLVSSNGEFTWTFQLDGNIVLYGPNPCNQVMWASNTAGHHNCWSLVMQIDGNLVAYDANGGAFFATNTVSKGGTEVVVQADGNVVMYNNAQTSSPWSTNTYLPPVPSAPLSTSTLGVGQGIIAGQAVTSPDGRYNFTLQTDANVVFYGPGSLNSNPLPPVVWAAGTNGHLSYPWFLVMQRDGNLVAYDSAGKAYWASNTNGHPGATFVVVSTGKAAVADPSGNVLWTV